MKTTLGEIWKYGPCESGWAKGIEALGTDDPTTEVTMAQILENNGLDDAIWALRTQDYRDICGFLADVAELALPVWRAYAPSDRRIEHCICIIRRYRVGLSTAQDLKAATAAADAAWAAADAARAEIEKLYRRYFCNEYI